MIVNTRFLRTKINYIRTSIGAWVRGDYASPQSSVLFSIKIIYDMISTSLLPPYTPLNQDCGAGSWFMDPGSIVYVYSNYIL